MVLTVLVTGLWRQLVHPYLEHDDWDFLLPVTHARIAVMHDRLLWEGRWFNFVWWRAVGHLFTPFSASLSFILAMLALATVLAWRWAPGWLSVPTAVALFASPMAAILSYWPATLAPMFWMLAIAAGLLPRCLDHPRRLAAWIVVATLLLFLAYPPAALVLLVVLVVDAVERSWRQLALMVITFGVTYAASTALVFSLNGIALGSFGIQVRPWRNPNKVHDLGDLLENIRRVGGQVGDLVGTATIPVVLGLVALAACAVVPSVRARGLRLIAVAVVALGVQSSATVLTGVSTPFRSMLWVWPVIVVAFVWLARATPSDARLRVAAILGLIGIAAWGVHSWRITLDDNQHRRASYQRILDRLAVAVHDHPGYRVLVLGTEADWKTTDFSRESQYLSQKALYDHGIQASYCHPPVCDVATRPSVLARAGRGGKVFVSSDFIVVVPAAHLGPGGR